MALRDIPNPIERVELIARVDSWADDPEQVLIEALWDPYPQVRFDAAESLAERLSDERVLCEIVTRTFDEQVTDDVRRAALLALRRSVSQSAIEVLLEATADSDPAVRYHALLALHENDAKVSIRTLAETAIVDGDDDVAIVGAQWAAQHNWTDLAAEIDKARTERRDKMVRLQFAIALVELTEDPPDGVVSDLIGALKDDRTARPATLAIAQGRFREAIPALQKLTRRFWFHIIIRIDAAAALTVLGESDGDEKLRRHIHDKREHVGAYACECVGRHRLEDFESDLLKATEVKDDRALAAVVALSALSTDSARLQLREIADHHPVEVVRKAAEGVA